MVIFIDGVLDRPCHMDSIPLVFFHGCVEGLSRIFRKKPWLTNEHVGPMIRKLGMFHFDSPKCGFFDQPSKSFFGHIMMIIYIYNVLWPGQFQVSCGDDATTETSFLLAAV